MIAIWDERILLESEGFLFQSWCIGSSLTASFHDQSAFVFSVLKSYDFIEPFADFCGVGASIIYSGFGESTVISRRKLARRRLDLRLGCCAMTNIFFI